MTLLVCLLTWYRQYTKTQQQYKKLLTMCFSDIYSPVITCVTNFGQSLTPTILFGTFGVSSCINASLNSIDLLSFPPQG